MEPTQEEREILTHVVINPDAWVENAVKTVGEWAVKAKIDRWRPVYEAEKDKPDYKNRAERDAIENFIPEPTEEQLYESAIKAKEAEYLRAKAIELIELEKIAAEKWGAVITPGESRLCAKKK